MEHSVSYRLSLDEIRYLSAAQKEPVKTLFGLRGSPAGASPMGDMDAPDWGGVKQSLLNKQLIWRKDGKLMLCSFILAQVIDAVSRPQMLAAVRPYEGGEERPLTRLYVRAGFAVSVEDDRNSDNYYLLRAHTNSRQAQKLLEESFHLGGKAYAPGTESMTVQIPELEGLLGAVSENNQTAFYNGCFDKGLSKESVVDLYAALCGKNRLTNYVVYAFDPDYSEGRRQAHEAFLYGGSAYMWKIKISPREAHVSAVSRETIMDDVRVMSRIMDFR